MPIILRATKGAALSVQELDVNFTSLYKNARVYDITKAYEVDDIVLYTNGAGYKLFKKTTTAPAGTTPVAGANWTLLDLAAPNIGPDLTLSGNIVAGGNMAATNMNVSADLKVGKDLVVQGNLTVLGDFTDLEVSTLNVEDKNITVAKGTTSRVLIDGGGLTWGDVTQAPMMNFNYGGVLGTIEFYNVDKVKVPSLSATGNILGGSLSVSGGIVGGSATIAGPVSIGGSLQVNSTASFAGNVTAPWFIGNVAGHANTAFEWETPRNLSMTGDVSGVFANVKGNADVIANVQINPLAVGTPELATNAVTTVKVADLNITSSKLEVMNGLNPGTYGAGNIGNTIHSNLVQLIVNNKGLVTGVANLPTSLITQVGALTNLTVLNNLVATNLTVTGNLVANTAATASEWATPRNLTLSGDVTGVFANLKGNADVTANVQINPNTVGTLELQNFGPGAGNIGGAGNLLSIAVDSKGRILTAENVPSTTITRVGNLIDLNVLGNVAAGKDLIVQGNLTVLGDYTVLNVATLDVEDKNIQLGSQTDNRVLLDGAGVTYGNANIPGGPPTINYVTINNSITVANVERFIAPGLETNDLTVTGNIHLDGTIFLSPSWQTITGNIASFDMSTASSYQWVSNPNYTGVLNINVVALGTTRKEITFLVDELSGNGMSNNEVLINFTAGSLRNSPYGNTYMLQEGESATFIINAGRAYVISSNKQPYVIEGGYSTTPEANV